MICRWLGGGGGAFWGGGVIVVGAGALAALALGLGAGELARVMMPVVVIKGNWTNPTIRLDGVTCYPRLGMGGG